MDAVVEVRLAPTGEVRIAGESWSAELEGSGVAEIGESVVVTRVDDIKLLVVRPEREKTENSP
jgi:membrane protein implicated in regulation of membrane protease activity